MICGECGRFYRTNLQGYGYCGETMGAKMDYHGCDRELYENDKAARRVWLGVTRDGSAVPDQGGGLGSGRPTAGDGSAELGVTRLRVVLDEGAFRPERAHPYDAGLDLMARERQVVWPGQRHCFDTGVHVAIPEGHVGLITSKSGLMRDHGILTSGTIDSGYTGSLRVVLFNLGDTVLDVMPGRKIAQLVILPIITPEVEIVDRLPESARGDGGFGSTGAFGANED